MRTLAEHVGALVGYLPGGRLFGAKSKTTSNIYKLLTGIANEMLTTDELIKTFRTEIIPSLTEDLLPEWEKAVGIPDDCFPLATDDDTRRLYITMKLAALGAQKTAEFQAIVDLFTATITISNAVDNRGERSFPMTFPFELDGDILPGDRFTVILNSSESLGDSFPLTFPVSFGGGETAIAECLVRKLIPANCQLLSRET